MIINPYKTHKSATNRFKTLEEEYNKIHNNKYDYSKTVYNGDSEKITITCPKHGDFEQRAGEHLHYGCRHCAVEYRSQNLSLGNDEAVDRCKNKHGDKFDYSNVVYKNSSTLLKIKCIIHNHTFYQTYSEHIKSKYACPICISDANSYDKYKNKPTTLYIIKINDLYKVGVTQSGINARYSKELKEGIIIETLYEKVFEDGLEAYSREQEILQDTIEFVVDRMNSPLVNGGYTELRYINLYEYSQKLDWFEI